MRVALDARGDGTVERLVLACLERPVGDIV